MATARDHADAERIARAAGDLLMELRGSGKARGADLGAAGDRRSHELLMAELARLHPGEPVLSEEGKGRVSAAADGRLWIVDPLDGTREYGEGRSDWAVHVALTVAGEPVAGAVALPADGLAFATGRPVPLQPPAPAPRMVVSRSRPPAFVPDLAQALGAIVIEMGSAGAKTMAVLRGQAEIYVHAGGQYEWDSAAPVAVALACGLHCSRLDGSPLVYGSPDAWMPDQLVCHPAHAGRTLDALRRLVA